MNSLNEFDNDSFFDMIRVKKLNLHNAFGRGNNHIEKIDALFDSYSLRDEQIESLKKHLDERFDRIEIDTGYLVSRVSRVKKLVK